jgi:hypothetical protein
MELREDVLSVGFTETEDEDFKGEGEEEAGNFEEEGEEDKEEVFRGSETVDDD